jgi:lysophospholipase L1-like esterase
MKHQRITIFFLSLFLSWIGTETYLHSQNTLYNNGNWTSSKMELAKGVIGAAAYVITRPALGRDALDLGAWLGYQEVLFKTPMELGSLEFDFTLTENSYFLVIFDKADNGFFGARFSTSPDFKSIFFKASAKGAFLSEEELTAINLNRSQHFEMRREQNEVKLFLNGVLLKSFENTKFHKGYFGFRGGPRKALIDNIRAQDIQGQTKITETFKNNRGWLKVFFIFLSLIFLSLLGSKKWPASFTSNRIIVVYTVLVACAGFYYLIDYYVLAGRYPPQPIVQEKVAALGIKRPIETAEEVDRKIQDYAATTKKSDFRLLFLGGSQTWGAGATREGEDLVNKIQEKLKHDKNSSIQCINGGISSLSSSEILKLYFEKWFRLNPKIVVANFSNNDFDPKVFDTNLERLIAFNKEKNIKTVLVLEFREISEMADYIVKNHEIIRQKAAKYKLSLFDLQSLMNKNMTHGFMLWDSAHFTSHAQDFVAAQMSENLLEPLIKQILKNGVHEGGHIRTHGKNR